MYKVCMYYVCVEWYCLNVFVLRLMRYWIVYIKQFSLINLCFQVYLEEMMDTKKSVSAEEWTTLSGILEASCVC